MNYECKVETKSPIRRQLTISVKPDAIKGYMEQQLSQVQKSAKIPGFRPGKVPMNIIRQYYLEDIKSKVFSNVIRDSYIRALEDNKITAVGTPEITPTGGTDLNEGEELTYTATVETFPEIELKGLSKLKVGRPSAEVSDEDVEKSLQNLREAHSEIVPNESYEGPAKEGDLLDISFKGTVGGEALDSLKAENRLIEIGARQFMEEFEHALIGLKKSESKAFTVNFPEDFTDAKLAGKPVEFNVTVHEFKKKQLPELDDEFAKQFKLEGKLELRKKVFETMKEDREKEARDRLKENVLRALVENHEFEVPSAMVRSQLEYLAKENAEYLSRNRFTEKMVKDYLEANREKLEKRAEEQVKASLILDKIAEDQNIKVEQADLDNEYSKVAERLNMPAAQVKQLYDNDENARRQLNFRIKEERTLDYILGQVQVTEEKAAPETAETPKKAAKEKKPSKAKK